MAETGHTPGPWKQAHVVSAYETKRRVIVAAEDSQYAGCPVGEVYGTTDEDCKANARLIAAAPDLLHELREVLAWAREENAPLRQQEIDSIEAAIAKATGAAP